MTDRFKFRVWDKRLNRYLGNSDPTQMLLDNGNLAYLDDDGMKFYEVEFCTGLKDKKGKLIYEGDILEVKVFDKKNYNQKKQTYWTVEWHEHRNNHGFMVYGINRRWNAPVAINKLFNAEAVVVGNIHENADLLGEE